MARPRARCESASWWGPGPVDSLDAAGPYATVGDAAYQIAGFAIPILGTHGRWFYTTPENGRNARAPWALLGLYLGAVRYGNLFPLDVGPDRAGRLPAIDERTLMETGRLIREIEPCSLKIRA